MVSFAPSSTNLSFLSPSALSFFPFLLPLVFIKSPYFKCTAQQPHKQENQIVITPAPRLEISYVVRTLFPLPFLPPLPFYLPINSTIASRTPRMRKPNPRVLQSEGFHVLI